MRDYADHWRSLIEDAIGYIAPDSINGKKLKPTLEAIYAEARGIADRHFQQAMANGAAANSLRAVNEKLLEGVKLWASECGDCNGSGWLDGPDLAPEEHGPCGACSDIRALIDLATKESA